MARRDVSDGANSRPEAAERAAGGPTVGPFRAVLAAHVAATRNRVRRELGRRGLAALGGLVGFGLLASLVPVGAGTYLGGRAVATLLEVRGAEVVVAWVFAFWLVTSVLQGSLAGEWWLPWERYRAFPVSPRTLFLAELFASFGRLRALIDLVIVGGFLAGVAVGRPSAAGPAAAILVEALVFSVALEQLVAAAIARLGRGLRRALWLVPVAAVSAGALLLRSLERARLEGGRQGLLRTVARTIEWLGEVGERLPTIYAGASLGAAARGEHLHAWLWHLPAVGALLALLGVGYAIARSEARAQELAIRDGAGRRERLPFARSAWLSLAYVDWRGLLASSPGAGGLVAPAAVVALLRVPATGREASAPLLVGFSLLFAAFSVGIAHLALFGRDGRGVRTLLLLPVETRTLLTAKAAANALYHATSTTLVAAVLAILASPPLDLLASGLALSWGAFFVYSAIGQRTSAWMPRAIVRGARGRPLALPVVLVWLGTGLLYAALALGLWAWTALRDPALLFPLCLAVALACALVWRLQLPGAVRFVEARRDRLLRVSE